MNKLENFFKTSFVCFTLLACVSANARSVCPDSVYIDFRRIMMFTYGSHSVSVLEATFDGRNRMVLNERTADRADSALMSERLYPFGELRLGADCERELLGKKIPVPGKYGYEDYTFFSPGRYATVRWTRERYGDTTRYETDHYIVSNAWKQESIGNFNFGVLYDCSRYLKDENWVRAADDTIVNERYDFDTDGFVIPLANGKYLIYSAYYSPVAEFPADHDYHPRQILSTRQLMYDTDTVRVDGRYGLYTMAGREVIPPVYDSLVAGEILARGYRGGRVDLLDYTGGIVASDLRLALPVAYRIQVLEDDGTMYFLDAGGNREDKYTYWYMSVDDILYPLGLDIVLLAPGKSQPYKKNTARNTGPIHG